MNKFRKIGTSVLFLANIVLLSATSAQSVKYFPASSLQIDFNHAVQLAGKIDSNYLMYHARPGFPPQLIVFDLEGNISSTVPLSFIRAGLTTNINMVIHPSRLDIIVQELRNGTHYTILASLNGKGEMVITPRYIDSTRYDLYGPNAFYSVVSSSDKKYAALFRVVRGFSSTQIMVEGILLDERGEKTGKGSFYIPYSAEQEMTGRPFVNNAGSFFVPVYDKPTNYRVGTQLRIYQTNFSSQPVLTSIYLKENKPTDFMMDWFEAKKQLVLGGLYYDFYEKRIEGAFTAHITPGRNRADTIILMPLEKSFRKELKSRIYNMSTIDIINSMQVRYFKVEADGQANLLTDVFTNSSFISNASNKPMLPSETPAENYYRSNPDLFASRNRTAAPNTLTDRDLSAARSANTASTRAIPGGNIGARGNRNSLSNSPAIDPPSFRPNNMPNAFRGSSFADAGDILTRNRTLDYKSVIFSVKPAQDGYWKGWTRNLYVPGTVFSNVIIVPNKTIGLLNYEINNKNVHYLKSSVFLDRGKVSANTVGTAGSPMLFYKKNAVVIDENSMLTLYHDADQNVFGLALINW